MSEPENIDLPNNLCVAEAAFEQFQAVSAYEEDEFITLSDIVDPPRPTQPTLDLNACLDEIQDDVCIVSEFDPQLDQNIASECTVETTNDLLTPLPTSYDKESNSTTGNSIQTGPDIYKEVPQPAPQKKGRRRKNPLPSVEVKEQLNTSSISEYSINECVALGKDADGIRNTASNKSVCDILTDSASSEVGSSTRYTSRRRKRQPPSNIPSKAQPNVIATNESLTLRSKGRQKKVAPSITHQDTHEPVEKCSSETDTHIEDSVANDNVNDFKDSNKDLLNMPENSAMSSKDTEQCLKSNKKTPRRRGRPKKSDIHNEDKNQLESNEVINTSVTSKQNSSVSSSKPEKSKSKNKEEKKYDEIELELLRMLTTPTEELEQNSNKIEAENQEKPLRKRVRKPKKLIEEAEKSFEKSDNTKVEPSVKNEDVDDETDDICLSSLKKRLRPDEDHIEVDDKEENNSIVIEKEPTVDNVIETFDNVPENSTKHNTKKPVMSDFEYNIDTVVSESISGNIAEDVLKIDNPETECPETESPSKRPIRKKAKKVLHYDEGSDEDPFANVELSDDDADLSGRRGGRYYSDEEYIPGKKKRGKAYTESESSLSESEDLQNDETIFKKLGKKRGRKQAESSKKRQCKKHDQTQNAVPDVTSTTADTTTLNDDDSLQSPDITTNENSNQKPSQAWGMSHEFENFIAQKIQGTNLKIKKLTGTKSKETAITPLKIPVLDPNEPKKAVEVSTQTNKTSTNTVEVQTTSPHEGVMKSKIPLTAVQSEKACEFLKGIVRNTSELGQLMIQKSEDFIQKKINTKNITDTNKLDYCVQKSFLLFKLAKHNLIQMEEDLANEYEQFLQSHNMSHYREKPKCIKASSKQTNSDSDCEIVEEVVPEQEKKQKDTEKSNFNLKTVFLNKELSIKMAKKSSEKPQISNEKMNVKGRHTVWINDSIMVKKVKPNQSFLAQDSRNKKPPDTYILIDMVREFFDNYYKRQKVLSTCAPFVSPEWLSVKQIEICNYFIAESNGLSTHSRKLHAVQNESQPNINGMSIGIKENLITQPRSLLTMCTKALNKYMYERKPNNNESSIAEHSLYLPLDHVYKPKTLFSLSFNVVLNMLVYDHNKMQKKVTKSQSISSLKKLCLKNINIYIHGPPMVSNLSGTENVSRSSDDIQNIKTKYASEPITNTKNKRVVKSLFSHCVESIQQGDLLQKCNNLDINENNITLNTVSNVSQLITTKPSKRTVKSLFSCCVEAIQRDNLTIHNITFKDIKTLKCLAFEKVKNHLYNDSLSIDGNNIFLEQKLLTTNNVENIYSIDKADQLLALTIKSVNTLSDDIFAKLPEAVDEVPPYSEDDNSNYDEYEPADELNEQYVESNQYDNIVEENNWVSRVQLQELKSCFMPMENNSKTPIVRDSDSESVLASIKVEPLEEASENIDTSTIKTEIAENYEMNFNPLPTKVENFDNEPVDIPEQSSSSYDVDAFEEFARTSKMLHSEPDDDLYSFEVFSQSAQRVRRQHEPDIEDEFDTSMSLLVPQENTDVAKDRLMKSSSDEEYNTENNLAKKKRKIRAKIPRHKNKDVTIKNKTTPDNEVAVLTRKMQERIRQEEKSDDSSDSEHGESLATFKNDKSKKEAVEKTKLTTDKGAETEIQCNDVDSTNEYNDKSTISNEDKNVNEKYLKKTTHKKTKKNNLMDKNYLNEPENSFVIQPDTPVELLECEPTLPMMHDYDIDNIETETEDCQVDDKTHEPNLKEEPTCIDRHGWKCYPVNNNDTKLYEHTYILLEKLPESFVETYFRYQGVADKDQDDTDIDRLTNLQSLHRTYSKDNKARSKTSKILQNSQPKSNDTENSQASTPANDDHLTELSPSEDEGTNVDDEIAPARPLNASENVMAKNSLMNDVESDSEKPIKQEAEEGFNESNKEEKDEPISKRCRPGSKSKKVTSENDATFLTADKMMNKELALLHAPVELDTQEVNVNDAPKKPSPKNLSKNSSRLRTYLERDKLQDESSSEEEKQWVTTKEKLLKRLIKKQGNPSMDDAKRAKIVNEFIEKHGDAHEKRPITRSRKRRSRKKYLERKKQMSVLNRELLGEPDTSFAGRKRSQAFGKGRRNIRKVINKKSLARSTVIANMEEFERKRRLNMQQTRLREELGCEEGVNVLVINDEVCLEYDFEQMRPVVTIHPFFTKVMKAHQYEGVKFMWDACFESLAMVSSGHPGGGCILAHCMGLGKTLQVLALLHTVLTHPGVGMKRVLVCCPLSTVLNWVDEINKWIGPVTNQIKVFELSKLKKTYERAYQLEDWYKDGGIFIIGYELFRSLSTLDPILDEIKPKIVEKIRHALLNPGPDVVICDEGHLLKNDASVLAVAMSRVATRRRIVLTGTPMQNNLREYYCMVNFVKPSLLGTYSEYSNRFENPIMNGQHRDSQEEDIKLMKARTHILHKVLEGCLQRQEASVLYPYLPKKHEYTVFIPPTKCQWDLYKHYIMTYALEEKKKQSLLKDFHVLQKIWTHPQVLHNFLMKARDERNKIKEEKLEDDLAQEDLAASEDVKPSQTEVWWLQYLAGGDMLQSLDSSNKFVVVFQLLDEFVTLGDKVLIFSTSLYTMDALEYFLKRIKKWSLGQEYFRLDGSVPPEVRQKWCREFNAPNNVNTKLFLISTRAGSLGLNMTAANRVIILDTSWNPAHDIQSIFRVYRFGQKKDCFIYRLVAMGTMEQKIYERSVTKQAVSCRVVDEQQIDRHYNLAELTELYRYDEEGATVEAGLAAGVSDVALLRVAARARLHAVREHDSLLRGSREQHLPEHERNAAWMQFQQEHANNEMQDRLLEASQGIQRILESKYVKPSGSTPVNTEVEEQPQQVIPQPGPKSRKGKKKVAPPEESVAEESSATIEQKEMQMDPEKVEAKVQKIMQLLIKHKFHTSQRAHDITQLVTNVRQIVDASGAGLNACDELTRSIATVMLQEEQIPIPPPPLTDIVSAEIVTSPTRSEVKQETSIQIPDETSDEIVDEPPEEVTDSAPEEIIDRTQKRIIDRISYQDTVNDGSESSLLVPVSEKKRRGRPRKCFHDEIFEPAIKRPRGRRRQNTTDTDQSSIDDEVRPSNFHGKKSKRLEEKQSITYASDLDSSVHEVSSKEQSPELDDRSLLVRSGKQRINKRKHIVSDTDVTIIDDEDNTMRSKDSEPFVAPDVAKEIVEPEVKKPRRAIAVKSTAKSQVNYNGKMKRKAALAAEQHLEKLDDDIVTLDDDVEWVNDSDKNTKNKTTRNTSTKTSQNDVKSSKKGDSCILLSDDEDRGKKNVPQNADPNNSTSTQAEEIVPLHPLMLSNPNFIKIVAYAYQSNRMLDEDAALLAARYSTEKALKEYETTGKDITSGPLYDIAVKVLTKDVLKKLYNKQDKKGSKKNETSVISDDIVQSTKQNTSKADALGEKNSQVNYDLTSSDYTAQPNVVPVGMFRGSGVNQKSHEVVAECILPDDDDCILGTTDESMPTSQKHKRNTQQFVITSVKATTGPQRAPQPVSAETIVPEMDNPIIIPAAQSHVTSSAPSGEPFVTISDRSQFILAPNTPTFRLSKSNLKIEPTTLDHKQSQMSTTKAPLTLTISEGKLINQPASNIAQTSNTICLDSDDEDAGAVTNVPNIVHVTSALKPNATHASGPTPVAVTTSVPSYSGLNNVQGIVMRFNNVHPKGTSLLAQAQSKTNQQLKDQPKKLVLVPNTKLPNNVSQQTSTASPKTSAPPLKFPKMILKTNENTNRDASGKTKLIINPEDVLVRPQPDQSKVKCKPGDILKLTRQGHLAVLSRVEKPPGNLKLSSNPGSSSNNAKSQQKGATLVDRRPSSSNTSAPAGGAGYDPLSILKNVVHIQADEYNKPRLHPDKVNHIEANLVTSMNKNKETGNKIKLKYPLRAIPDNSTKGAVSKKSIDRVPDKKHSSVLNVDLTNLMSKTVTDVHKSKDKQSSIVIGSSKDIIIRTKSSGSSLSKPSTSAANTIPKKRITSWSGAASAKTKAGLRPVQTLEDFDIDDMEDIIELE